MTVYGCAGDAERVPQPSESAAEVGAEQVQQEREDPEPVPPPPHTDLPPGEYVAISVGGGLHCGILTSGEVECGGRWWMAGRRIPPGPYRTIEVGSWFGCGIKVDGEIRCWGLTPGVRRISIIEACGSLSSALVPGEVCGIDELGTVRCWGHEEDGENQAAERGIHTDQRELGRSCAVAGDTRIVCWGRKIPTWRRTDRCGIRRGRSWVWIWLCPFDCRVCQLLGRLKPGSHKCAADSVRQHQCWLQSCLWSDGFRRSALLGQQSGWATRLAQRHVCRCRRWDRFHLRIDRRRRSPVLGR